MFSRIKKSFLLCLCIGLSTSSMPLAARNIPEETRKDFTSNRTKGLELMAGAAVLLHASIEGPKKTLVYFSPLVIAAIVFTPLYAWADKEPTSDRKSFIEEIERAFRSFFFMHWKP